MLFLDKYFRYVKSAFIDHKYLLIFTVVFAVLCWIWGYFIADWLYVKQDLVDNYAYLSQITYFSFDDMIEIIINNCLLNITYYLGSVFFGLAAIYDMMSNIGMSGIVSRATELACGDPFLFLKLTCLHGFFEDLSTILNSFAGFILFSFVVRFIKDVFSPSKRLANGTITNSLEINKKHLYQSIAIFVLAFFVMIFAGFLEEYISIPFGNFIASVF